MVRYVAIVGLLIPFALAAPLPREVTGLNTWVFTRDELAKIPFPPESEALDASEKGITPNPGELALGLHINGNSYRSGQSIPALIVIKNLQDKDAGLDMCLEFYDAPHFVNSCNIVIRERKTATRHYLSSLKSWQCGGRPTSVVPANGYHCQRADFGTTSEGPLPPGDYECHWTYGRLRSNIVQFTVTDSQDAKTTTAPKRSKTTVLQIMTYSKDEEQKESDDKPAGNIVLNNTGLDRHRVEDLAQALGSGVKDQYYPNIRDLPAEDSTIRLETSWTKHKGQDQLVVTLKSIRGHQRVKFHQQPTLFLIIEAEGREDFGDAKAFAREKDAESKSYVLETPLTFDIRLADAWKECSGQSGRVRIRVLVCSERLELDRESNRMKELSDSKATKSGEHNTIWSGVLLSSEQTFDFPVVKVKKSE